MMEEIFETLGFKPEESRAYLTLLDLGGASSGSALAKAMDLPRASVYGYLDKLVAGGLVNQSLSSHQSSDSIPLVGTPKRTGKTFIAEPPERLRLLYKRKIDHLKTKEKLLDTIIPSLEEKSGTNLYRPRIHIFEGRNGMETALQDFLKYDNLYISSFWSIKAAIQATSEDFFWYINKERIKKNSYIQAIWPQNQVIDIKRYPSLGVGPEFKREIRIAPKGLESDMGYWSYANKVLFCSSNTENFSFIIESAELHRMINTHHIALWNISSPLIANPEDMRPFLDDI